MSVSRIDPDYNVPGAPVHIDNVVPDGPGSVAAQGNSVWVAPSNGLLTRLDAITGSRRGSRSIRTPARPPSRSTATA